MALYWHFPSKDKLIAAVAARIWGEKRLGSRRGRVPEPPDGSLSSSEVLQRLPGTAHVVKVFNKHHLSAVPQMKTGAPALTPARRAPQLPRRGIPRRAPC